MPSSIAWALLATTCAPHPLSFCSLTSEQKTCILKLVACWCKGDVSYLRSEVRWGSERGRFFVFFSPAHLLFFFFFKILIYLFIYYFWLCWVFVSVRGLSPIAASGGHSSSRCAGLSLSRPLLWSTVSRRAGSVVVAHGPSCSAACGIFPDQGSNPCPLHWQVDSQPLCHQGSPRRRFYWESLH